MKWIKWIKWYFYDTKRCNHEPSNWYHIDFGRNKAKFCIKCGKCLFTLDDLEKA